MLIIWSETKRGGALNETMRLGPVSVLDFAPAPKKAVELMWVENLPVSWAFCLKASARCQVISSTVMVTKRILPMSVHPLELPAK